ncbi:MAG: flagellar basal body-associated FliL family protein [Pseudomonadota bacterium]
MGKILPLLLLLVGIGAGVGAGLSVAPDGSECAPHAAAPAGQEGEAAEDCEHPPEEEAKPEAEEEAVEDVDFVRMNDQFVVPVLVDGSVRSLVVMSITLEADLGSSAGIFAIEPKLRDAFLRVLFDHANSGGFSGAYTEAGRMDRLRRALLEIARKVAGEQVRDILILDMLRQEV